MFTLDRIATELRDTVAALDPATYAGRDAARLVEVAAQGERLFAAAKVLLAKRAVDASSWRTTSHAATPEQWFANVSGTSEHTARQALQTADRVADLPATETKLRDGSLSIAQATQVTLAASVAPESESSMLRCAERDGMRELTRKQERVVAAVTDLEEAQRRAHRTRGFRTWTRGVETHGSFNGPTTEVAKLLDTLAPRQRRVFDEARRDGRHEPQHAYRFDALVGLAESDRADGNDSKTRTSKKATPLTRITVDLSRLLGTEAATGEGVCEIPGVGPVPVSHARAVLPHGLLELVLRYGRDVRAIVTQTRHVPEALKIAVAEASPTCKVRGCDRTEHLERHHIQGFAEHQLTAFEILGPACPEHHDLITYDGYTIDPRPDGDWILVPPDEHLGEPERRDTDAA
ncbi:MAG: HNH endonuclease signature motif containing protein [Acidimicrobiia bacterium]